MQPKILLLTFLLLAVAGMDFIMSMHTAETSSTINTDGEDDLNFDYEKASLSRQTKGNDVRRTGFLFADLEEKNAIIGGYHLRFQTVTARKGSLEFPVAKFVYEHKCQNVAKIQMELYGNTHKNVKMAKDLEGIELHFVWEYFKHFEHPEFVRDSLGGFRPREENGKPKNLRYDKTETLSNGQKVKGLKIKLPKEENAPTEEEKRVLKAIFIGGHKIHVEVHSDGNGDLNAKLKLLKNISPGTMQFTLDYSNQPGLKGQMESWSIFGKHFPMRKSTFSVNWATFGLEDIEELRTVKIRIHFKNGAPSFLAFTDFSTDQLEQLFAGGQAKIVLSKSQSENCRVTDLTNVVMPTKSAFETVSDKVMSLFHGKVE